MTGITKDTKHFGEVKILIKQDNIAEEFSGPGTELTYYAANVVGSRIYMFGPKLKIPNVFYFDTARWKWELLETEMRGLRDNSSVLVDDRVMGLIGLAEPSKGLLVFDLSLNEFSLHSIKFPTDLIPKRSISEYIGSARTMVVFGGYEQKTVNALVGINVDSFEVSVIKASGQASPPRHGHVSCIVVREHDATIFIYGGGNGSNPQNDLYLLHYRKNRFRWSQGVVNSDGIKCFSPSLTYVEGKLFLYGGFDKALDDIGGIYVYELDTESWHVVTRKQKGISDTNTHGYCIDADLGDTSTHRTFLCSRGLLILGGYERKFPWVNVLCEID